LPTFFFFFFFQILVYCPIPYGTQTNILARSGYPGRRTTTCDTRPHGRGAAAVPEEDRDEEGHDEDGDVNIDAAAEAEAGEIARRLGDQLWESINKARAEGANGSALSSFPSRSEEAALATMAVIAGIEKDPLARSTFLSTAAVPECLGKALLDVLTETVAAGRVPKGIAQHPSDLLVGQESSLPVSDSQTPRPSTLTREKETR
jgi:hypothetical protein